MNQRELARLLNDGVELTSSQITSYRLPSLTAAIAKTGNASSNYVVPTHIPGAVKRTILTFSDLELDVTDDGATASLGQQLLDFPLGVLVLLGVRTDLSGEVTASWAPTTPVMSIGTAAAGSGATLTGTEADILPSTALTIASDAFDFAPNWLDAITVLTDSTGATPDSTIADHADGSTYGTDAAAIENNVSDLAAKINEILAAYSSVKILAFDGSVTAKDLYLNFAANSDPSTGKTITLNGTLELDYLLL